MGYGFLKMVLRSQKYRLVLFDTTFQNNLSKKGFTFITDGHFLRMKKR
jgi:hypothetical protein